MKTDGYNNSWSVTDKLDFVFRFTCLRTVTEMMKIKKSFIPKQ